MKYRYDPSGRSYVQPNGGQRADQQSPFPGISDPFLGGANKSMGMNAAIPFDPTQLTNEIPSISIMPASGSVTPLPEQSVETVAEKAKSGFSLPSSLTDLKGIVDRMGGLDGIVSTMTKVQKVVGSITQMAPLIKVLAGSFGKKGAAASIAEDFDGDGLARPRRRKRRKRSGSTATGQKRRRTGPAPKPRRR